MSRKETPREGLIQSVLAGRVTHREAAASLKVSVRQFRRIRARYRVAGAEGLLHGNRGRPSPRRLPEELAEQITRLMAEKYAGFNDQHLTEKLQAVEGITVSRERVRRLRLAAGLPATRKRRAPKHRRRRERAPREGALVLIDGSDHDWLEGRGPRFTLIGAIDDATGRVLALVARAHEDLHGYVQLLDALLRTHGVPVALYGDRFGALVRNDDHWSLEEQLAGRQDPTQFGRILEELGVGYIAARSPQAKGRIERSWETLQDRLVSELRLLGLRCVEEVVQHLPQLLAELNARFAKPAREVQNAWRRPPRSYERILTCRYRRKVARDNTVSVPGRWIQLPARGRGRSWQGTSVEICEGLDGTVHVLRAGQIITTQPWTDGPFTLVGRIGSGRALHRRCDSARPRPQPVRATPPAAPSWRGPHQRGHKPKPDHPWKRPHRPQPPSPVAAAGRT
jgi:transposase